MISAEAVVSGVIFLIVMGMVFWLLWWLADYVGLPEPFNKVIHVVLAVAAVVVLIGILMGLAGHPIIRW